MYAYRVIILDKDICRSEALIRDESIFQVLQYKDYKDVIYSNLDKGFYVPSTYLGYLILKSIKNPSIHSDREPTKSIILGRTIKELRKNVTDFKLRCKDLLENDEVIKMIVDLCNYHYEEENIDIQFEPFSKHCPNQRFKVIIRFGDIEIDNLEGRGTYPLKEVYACLKFIRRDASKIIQFEGFALSRGSYSQKDLDSHYMHSHVCSLGSSPHNYFGFKSFCIGSGTPISRMIGNGINTSPESSLKFESFLLSIYDTVTHESISGGPYFRYLDILNSGSISNSVNHPSTLSNYIQNCDDVENAYFINEIIDEGIVLKTFDGSLENFEMDYDHFEKWYTSRYIEEFASELKKEISLFNSNKTASLFDVYRTLYEDLGHLEKYLLQTLLCFRYKGTNVIINSSAWKNRLWDLVESKADRVRVENFKSSGKSNADVTSVMDPSMSFKFKGTPVYIKKYEKKNIEAREEKYAENYHPIINPHFRELFTSDGKFLQALSKAKKISKYDFREERYSTYYKKV
jgi:hypothetical protein